MNYGMFEILMDKFFGMFYDGIEVSDVMMKEWFKKCMCLLD